MQTAALRKAGIRRIRVETSSGVEPRQVLEQLLADLSEGDVLVVYKLDRLARTLRELLRVLDAIAAAGAKLRSLTEPIDTTTPSGRLALQVMLSVSEFEREQMRERSMAGLKVARARGAKPGRPRALTPRGELSMIALYRTGHYTRAALARMHRISDATLARIFKRHGVETVPYSPPDDGIAA